MRLQEMQGKHDYENEAVFRRNCLPARSYYIPHTSLLLNGKWDFHYASIPSGGPEPQAFSTSEHETSGIPWSSIDVPGHWQLQGFGRPHYTNVKFPIPVCPPHIPTENPTGTYRRTFTVPASWDPDAQLRLRFDGVDSAYHVWINGLLVGYAQGSRNASEFDVTPYIHRSGANELHARVYQWSDATYIEDQDQWWLSGIFRDVHLIAFPSKSRIEDWFIRTDLDSNYLDSALQATVNVISAEKGSLKMTLHELVQNGGNTLGTAEISVDAGSQTAELSLPVSNPRKWTAETPYLYCVELALISGSKRHTTHQKVGFRKVELLNGLISVNGKALRIRGVNRHDHHPRLGRAVSEEFIRKDLLMMKAHNINSLRCSHYPSHPKLFEISDEIGLWVMDEADLECHGFSSAVEKPLEFSRHMPYEERIRLVFPKAAAYTSDNPAWKGAYLDRVQSMLQRDKNHASIIMWSLGNEAFYGQNHKAMYEYAKRVDPGRLVHYEPDTSAESADMYSYMYLPPEELVQRAKTTGVQGNVFEKPIVLCEYCHAMGNGPGLLEDYEKAFNAHSRLQGGWIWEWANHGLWKEEHGRGFYASGGDFGDWPNDGNFVLDGLCYSDHTSTPGLLEVKKVFQPVGLSLDTKDKLTINNLYDFVDLSHLIAVYKVEELGTESSVLAMGELEVPVVKPAGVIQVPLPNSVINHRSQHGIVVTISFRLRLPTSWAEMGHEVAWIQGQSPARGEDQGSKALPRLSHLEPRSKTSIQDLGSILRVSGLGWAFDFDRDRGYLQSWISGEMPLLEPDSITNIALMPSFWRPPTDNDVGKAMPYWKRFGVQALTSQRRHFSINGDSATVVIETATFLTPPVLDWGWQCHMRYTIDDNGSLEIMVHLKPTGYSPEHVPRVGLNLRASRALNQIRWCGLGPGESYPDKRSAQKIGIWSVDSVEELQTPYEMPQENGNRMDTGWVTFAGANGDGFQARRIYGELEDVMKKSGTDDWPNFSWAASRHSAQVLEDAKHPTDLVEEGAVLIRLDAKVAGVGTAACGPGVREDHLVHTEPMSFGFMLSRIRG